MIVAAFLAVIVLTFGLSALAQGTLYVAAGTFSTLGGPSEILPPGVGQGSSFSSLINLNTSNYSVQSGSPGTLFSFPNATLACSFTNGTFVSDTTYAGLALDFLASQSGATALEITASNSFSVFTLTYAGGSVPDNTLASLESFLNTGYHSALATNSAAELTYYNPLGGQPATASGSLDSVGPTSVPEPGLGVLTAIGGVALVAMVRRRFRLVGNDMPRLKL